MKYQRFTSSDLKDKGIRKFEFVAKTHFLCLNKNRLQLFGCILVNVSKFECANQRLADSQRYLIYGDILSYFWFNYFVYFSSNVFV